jgi:hypothetical protein
MRYELQRGDLNTDTQGECHVKMKAESYKSKNAKAHQQTGRETRTGVRNGSFCGGLQAERPCLYLDLGLPASRTGRAQMSAVSFLGCAILLLLLQ